MKECVREDIAASIFQAVVNQTIAGLASGRKNPKEMLALSSGPLFFMSEFTQTFHRNLGFKKKKILSSQKIHNFCGNGSCAL